MLLIFILCIQSNHFPVFELSGEAQFIYFYGILKNKAMRKKIVAGNWKMNLTIQEAKMLAINLTEEISNRPNSDVDILVCPPFPYISAVSEIISEHNKILTGAQNCATHASGAYTGEVSATMLASMNVGHVIIGHSERRAFYQEDDTILLEKLHQVLAAGIKPIFCCGETLQEREKNTQRDVIKNQLRNTIKIALVQIHLIHLKLSF
jgi:triosephosphate isomerase